MSFQKRIQFIKEHTDQELKRIFSCLMEQSNGDVFMQDAISYAEQLTLSGGKRLRPALFYYGFIATGGIKSRKIFKVAAAIELIHMSLLIHDDIIDRGEKRHGIKAYQKEFAARGKKMKMCDPEHFGNSMAIIAGPMLYGAAMSEIANANFPAQQKLKLISLLQGILHTTIAGQAQDILIEYTSNVSEKDIFRIYENKTARYSVEGPLHAGVVFSGNENKTIKSEISSFAIPLGIAYQLQDDILGIFGSEKKTGKSITSDIGEGKKTPLLLYALSHSTAEEKRVLESIIGKRNVTIKDVKIVKEIFTRTGALKYVEEKIETFSTEATQALKSIIITKEAKEFLSDLVSYLLRRDQ